ncbi:MAG: pal [Gemmatimonadetes bacterium]|jgi:peptidoglycan-associated lipoprotein|nr:pal [Gemmatimonadota bacterium]
MTARTAALSLAVVLSMAALGGCRRRVEPAPVPDPARSAVGDQTGAAGGDAAAAERARRQADSVAEANRAAAAAAAARAADAARAQAELTAVLQQRVFFDYDRDNLRDDAGSLLDAKAAILLANPGVSLAITGHTDERGTAEYNLALGQRRAAQVKRYLVSKGIADARLATGSLGDSEPAASGTDEGAFQQNRRAEFTVSNGGGALVRPQP